jgi:predicted nucleic acid-binding Zn ribbon protein
MKQLKKKSNEPDLKEIDVIIDEVSPSAEKEQRLNELRQMGPGELLAELNKLDQEDEIEELEDWDNTLLDGLEDEDWDEEFSEEEIQELINEIPEEEESIEQSLEANVEGEFIFEEGPYTFETDEEVAEIESQQDEFVVGAAMPTEEVTPVESVEEVVEQPRRREKKPAIQDDEEALLNYRKGPLWQYRTNNK